MSLGHYSRMRIFAGAVFGARGEDGLFDALVLRGVLDE